MAALAFHHVALTCNDPLAIERYYTKHFGFQRARVAPLGGGKQIVFLKSGAFYLELFQSEQPSPVPSPAPSWPQYPGGDGPHYHGVRHLAFKVDDVDAQLASMGAEAVITLGPLSFDASSRAGRPSGSRTPRATSSRSARGSWTSKSPARPLTDHDPPPHPKGENSWPRSPFASCT